MGSSKQEYWSGLPFPSPGDLLDPGIEPRSLALQADSLPSEPLGKLPPHPHPGMCTKVLFNYLKTFSFSLRKIPRMRVEISQYSSIELKAPWSLMVL